MARSIAAALLLFGIFSSGCATILANACASRSPSGCGGSDALLTASLLVIEGVAAGIEPLPPPRGDGPDAPGTRPPSR